MRHDVFTSTFNPSLLQTVAAADSNQRAVASRVLFSVARKWKITHMEILAGQVQLAPFTRVKQAIDDMVAQLAAEGADEIKHKDFCISELNQNQLDTEHSTTGKERLVALVDTLQQSIAELSAEVETLKKDIADLQVQLKRAGEARSEQNKDFQATVAEQRQALGLLQDALTVLDEFYTNRAVLVQRKDEPAGPAPPPGFKEFKKSSASGGAVGLIKQVIADARALEAAAIRDEEDAQHAYENTVKDMNNSMAAKTRQKTHKEKVRAGQEVDESQANTDLSTEETTLESLATADLDLHKSCDFAMKNFDMRQTRRNEEIEALRQAKAILSGAKFADPA